MEKLNTEIDALLPQAAKMIGERYLDSSDFNGVVLSSLATTLQLSEPDARTLAQKLVEGGLATFCFSKLDINIHIKRTPEYPLKVQVQHIQSEDIGEIGCYPTKDVILGLDDCSKYNDRPFSKMLALGEAQLEFKAFELAALERYANDPRYHFKFQDYSGQFCIGDDAYHSEQTAERDKTGVQTFGLGYKENGERVVIFFLRYLNDLTPEHQQHMNTYSFTESYKMCREYYINSIIGDFTENVSFFTGIVYELRAINDITKIIYGEPMFKSDFIEERPREFNIMLRPTLKNFYEFIHISDKILSENINKKFLQLFSLEFESETIHKTTGKVTHKENGNLNLLEQWLKSQIRWDDPEEAMKIIIQPLKEVRKLRQKPAHGIQANAYNSEWDSKQTKITKEIYCSLMHIRATLQRHPLCPEVELRSFLKDGNLRMF